MASENVEDWDQPLATPTERSDDTEEMLTIEELRHNNNLNELKKYIELMAYKPTAPIQASVHTESLSKPKKLTLIDNSKQFYEFMVPPERGERLKRLSGKHESISLEKVEQVLRKQKIKERKKGDILKHKQEIYYELLTKLEHQCRTQYLNVMLNKFSSFIAKLATTMRIPPTLIDPYARMQRGIFCNILSSIGVQPASQEAIYYNTKEGSKYEVCHKLSHALLSLIIKALDLASTRNPEDNRPIEVDFNMDNYVKDRLMWAAEKKIQNRSKSKTGMESNDLNKKLEECILNF